MTAQQSVDYRQVSQSFAAQGATQASTPVSTQASTKFHYEFAVNPSEVVESQRLRYRVFSQELGANINGQDQGVERDNFDPHCWHLLVRESMTAKLVASTRILTDNRAWQIGGFYSSQEFNLAPIAGRYGRVMEVGRTCVDPDFRKSSALTTLWMGLGEFLTEYGFDTLMGCASVSLEDGGQNLQAILTGLSGSDYVDESYRVLPRRNLPVFSGLGGQPLAPEIPPLLKGYLRLGARLGGKPCWDPDFNCADFLVLLKVADMPTRYAKRFLRQGCQ